MSTAEQLELDLKEKVTSWGLSQEEARSLFLLLGKLTDMPDLHIRYVISDFDSVEYFLLDLLTNLKQHYS